MPSPSHVRFRFALALTTLSLCAVASGEIVQQQKLLAGDGETPDSFGASVDSHKGRVIIGAKYGNFDFVLDCGAAYLWRLGEFGWEEDGKLNAPDATSNDVFGIAVALGDDVALVGAYHDDVKAGNDRAGSVYSFTRQMDGSWVFHEKFFAPAAVGGETFGCSIAIDGDAAIIGASRFNTDGLPGAAHVYRRDGAGDWIPEQTLTPPDSQLNDQFGWSVDINGDTAIVGAWLNDSGQGSAYVFTRDDVSGLWSAGVKITPDVRITGEQFGWSVSTDGDAVLVGATQGSSTETGAAYAFRSDGLGGWTQEARLVGAEAGPRAQVGRAVELRGDFALVGASEVGQFPTPGGPGSVYVFKHESGVWTQTDRVLAADGQADDQLGSAIAIDEDYMVVGARGDDDFGFSAGSSYVFDTHGAFCPTDLNRDFVTDTADLGQLIAAFGSSDPHADINGDGVVDTADLGQVIAAFGEPCN